MLGNHASGLEVLTVDSHTTAKHLNYVFHVLHVEDNGQMKPTEPQKHISNVVP